jgi:cobalt/nickel transport system permease protein
LETNLDNKVEGTQVLPEWMQESESYEPRADRDAFVNKSILSLLLILSKIKAQDSGKASKYQVNVTLKVAYTFLLVVLLSISRSFTFVILINVYLLAILSMMDAKDIIKVLRVSIIMAFFSFIILLPAAFWGNSYSIIMITSKVFATITAVNILSHTTKWNAITGALKRFFVPDIFILVLDITIKYIVMLGEFALNMMYSLKLRSVGKNDRKYNSLSGVAGTLFIKSKEMAEDMYHAMACRGYTGEYHTQSKFNFTIIDLPYSMLNMGIILLFVYLGRG